MSSQSTASSIVDIAHDDEGLGLLEIVISMFLIALIAIAFIPVLVSGLRASELNSTTATATRLVAQAVDAAHRAEPANCSALQLVAGTTTQVDAQGVTIEVVSSVPAEADCIEGSTNLVHVVARDASEPSRVLAEARTLLFLAGTP